MKNDKLWYYLIISNKNSTNSNSISEKKSLYTKRTSIMYKRKQISIRKKQSFMNNLPTYTNSRRKKTLIEILWILLNFPSHLPEKYIFNLQKLYRLMLHQIGNQNEAFSPPEVWRNDISTIKGKYHSPNLKEDKMLSL